MGTSCVLNGHRGGQEGEGFAILIEHIVLRVNDDISERGEGGGNDPQLGQQFRDSGPGYKV